MYNIVHTAHNTFIPNKTWKEKKIYKRIPWWENLMLKFRFFLSFLLLHYHHFIHCYSVSIRLFACFCIEFHQFFFLSFCVCVNFKWRWSCNISSVFKCEFIWIFFHSFVCSFFEFDNNNNNNDRFFFLFLVNETYIQMEKKKPKFMKYRELKIHYVDLIFFFVLFFHDYC